MTTPSAGVKCAEQETPEAKLAAYVAATVMRAPRLSARQADKNTTLLRSGAR